MSLLVAKSASLCAFLMVLTKASAWLSLKPAAIKASSPKLGEENMAIKSCAGHRNLRLL